MNDFKTEYPILYFNEYFRRNPMRLNERESEELFTLEQTDVNNFEYISLHDHEKEIASLKEQLEREQNDLAIAHAHIHNLQDAYNECRNWFSNVEYESETEELDELIDLSDCDEREAVNLKTSTEEFAMGWFSYYYAVIKERYNLKTLHEYIKWSDKQLDILSYRIRETQARREK